MKRLLFCLTVKKLWLILWFLCATAVEAGSCKWLLKIIVSMFQLPCPCHVQFWRVPAEVGKTHMSFLETQKIIGNPGNESYQIRLKKHYPPCTDISFGLFRHPNPPWHHSTNWQWWDNICCKCWSAKNSISAPVSAMESEDYRLARNPHDQQTNASLVVGLG